jgi:hypothetical protein
MQLRKFMGQGQKTATAFSLAPQASRLQASEKLYESEKRMELIQTTHADMLVGIDAGH